jgi:hypothetical protein
MNKLAFIASALEWGMIAGIVLFLGACVVLLLTGEDE